MTRPLAATPERPRTPAERQGGLGLASLERGKQGEAIVGPAGPWFDARCAFEVRALRRALRRRSDRRGRVLWRRGRPMGVVPVGRFAAASPAGALVARRWSRCWSGRQSERARRSGSVRADPLLAAPRRCRVGTAGSRRPPRRQLGHPDLRRRRSGAPPTTQHCHLAPGGWLPRLTVHEMWRSNQLPPGPTTRRRVAHQTATLEPMASGTTTKDVNTKSPPPMFAPITPAVTIR